MTKFEGSSSISSDDYFGRSTTKGLYLCCRVYNEEWKVHGQVASSLTTVWPFIKVFNCFMCISVD